MEKDRNRFSLPYSPLCAKLSARLFVFVLLLTMASEGAPQSAGPTVGVLVGSSGAVRFSSDQETSYRALNVGDLITEGTRITAGGGRIQFNYYPDNSLFSFTPASSTFASYPSPDYDAPDLRFSPQKVRKLRQGTLTPTPWPFPLVPPVLDDRSIPIKGTSTLLKPASSAKEGQFEVYLQSHPDPLLHLSRAVEQEINGDLQAALAGYQRVGSTWPRAVWLQQKIDRLQRVIKAGEPRSPRTPQMFAILVGSTTYRSPLIPQLAGAEEQVNILASHLASSRGGALPAKNIIVLTGKDAGTAALRSALRNTLVSKAGPGDSVFVFFALRGGAQRPGFLLAYDSDPRELAATAVSIDEVYGLLQEHLPVLKSLVPSSTATGNLRSAFPQTAGNFDTVLGATYRNVRDEGSFTVGLREALAGGADLDHDGRVTIEELNRYLAAKYPQAKPGRPAPRLNAEGTIPPILGPPALCLQLGSRGCVLLAASPLGPGVLPADSDPDQDDPGRDVVSRQVENALQENRFSDAAALVRDRPEDDETRQHTVIAMENFGHNVISRYLDGDEIPMEAVAFERCATALASAAALVPNYSYLRERELFCRGRVLVFRHEYQEAVEILENVIALDPYAAYAYNALGLAYLEQGMYADASRAFQDSVRLAPHWTYPRNNLGLTYSELGDYDLSRLQFDAALALSPKSSRLHHNSGLLFQRLNQKREAEHEYRTAIQLAPDQWEPYAALATVLAARNNSKAAQDNFNIALRLRPQSLPVKHDLAIFYWNHKDVSKAISLWEENIQADPEFLPSLYRLALAYEKTQQYAAAIRTYESVLRLRPDSLSMRTGLERVRSLSGNGAPSSPSK
jgi:tetratricopeptide (TPR) repeat protein